VRDFDYEEERMEELRADAAADEAYEAMRAKILAEETNPISVPEARALELPFHATWTVEPFPG